MPTRRPSSHSVSRLASASSARRSPRRRCRGGARPSTTPSSSCTQQPTIRPPHQAVVPALPLVSNRYGSSSGVEVEPALLPAHRGRVEHRAAAPPTAPARVRRPGRREAGIPTPSARPTSTAPELAQRAAYGGLGRAQPPDEVGLGAGPEGAQPAPDQTRVAGLRLGVSHRLAQPLLGQRPARPRASPAPVVGAAHDLAGRSRACPAPGARSGSCRRSPCPGRARAAGPGRESRSRSSAVVAGPSSARRAQHLRRTCGSSQASPSLGDARWPRPPWRAGCAAARRPAPRHSPTPPAAGRAGRRTTCAASRAA